MGDVIAFPTRASGVATGQGIVHCMPVEAGGYYVSHESSSGDSWGELLHLHNADDAFAGTQRMSDFYDGCSIWLCDELLAEMTAGGPNVKDRF